VSVVPFLPRGVVCSLACAVVFLILPSLALHGQDDLAPSEPASDALAPLETNASSPAQRDVSLRLLPNNFLHDQENIWLFPGRLARGRHWSPTIAVVAATAGLLAADPNVEPYFDHTTAFRGFDRAFASKLTGDETIAIPAALYLVGLGNRDSYMQKTALFAGEAVLDSEVVRMVINSVTTRWRPSDVARQATYGGTFFRDSVHVGSSFPSGHTIAAVSIATVVARRYRNHRWVPWVAYGLAGTIGFSRITLRAHFPSDVFLGGVLGYAIARYDVLRDN
jgi:membrane-associated phospholipid phosphatase